VAVALSRRYALLLIHEAKVIELHFLKAIYKGDEDFKGALEDPSTFGCFIIYDGFLFKRNKLCISKSPLWDLIVKEAHGGALAGHFGINKATLAGLFSINKTLEILKEYFITYHG